MMGGCWKKNSEFGGKNKPGGLGGKKEGELVWGGESLWKGGAMGGCGRWTAEAGLSLEALSKVVWRRLKEPIS